MIGNTTRAVGARTLLAAGVVLLAACQTQDGPTSLGDTILQSGLDVPANPDPNTRTFAAANIEFFEVCKRWVGTTATAEFEVAVQGGPTFTVSTATDFFGPDAAGWLCRDVWLMGSTGSVLTVTETSTSGANPYTTTVAFDEVGTPGVTVDANALSITGTVDGTSGVTAYFENTEVLPMLDGRMTGGGSIFDGNDRNNDRFTHGFELHCDPDDPRQNLEINWDGGNSFHLTDLTFGQCVDDPAIDPRPRRAGIDTFIGEGEGRLNGVDGATINFVFTDQGEPGTSDTAVFTIVLGGTTIGPISGNLIRGNHQAHTNN